MRFFCFDKSALQLIVFVVFSTGGISQRSTISKRNKMRYCKTSTKPLKAPFKDQNFLTYSCEIDLTLNTTYILNLKRLYSVPKDIPPNTTHLQITYNILHDIPPDVFKHLNNCEKLDLSYNRIFTVAENAFRGLNSLKCLDLKRNCITSVSLSGLISVEELYLASNTLNALGAGLFHELKSIKVLKVDINALISRRERNEFFQGVSITLVHLDLSSNLLTEIWQGSFQGLTSLKSLELQNNKIKEIQIGWFLSPKLPQVSNNFLNLSMNSLNFIQNKTTQGLSLMHYSQNKTQKLKNGPVQLQFLNLGFNKVQVSEHLLNEISRVKHLFLMSTKVSNEVDTFQRLEKLMYLDLSDTALSSMPHHFFKCLTVLETLNLSSNSIQTVHKEQFLPLVSLKHLNLSNNVVEVVESRVYLLPNLTELDLSKNKIVTVQSGAFQELPNLKRLYLNKNNLAKIDKGLLKGLNILEILDLDNNAAFQAIEPGSFVNIVLSNGTIKLITTFITGWNLFIDDHWLNRSHVIKSKFWKLTHVLLLLGRDKFNLNRRFCWIKHGRQQGLMQVETYCYSYKVHRKVKCSMYVRGCPAVDKCMEYDGAKCKAACKEGSISELIRDYEVCPFEFWCKCTCPVFKKNSCAPECVKRYQLPETRITESGCKFCSCVCPKVNCTDECFGHKYQITNNTFGCPKCSCICPKSSCDEKCNGTGLGIPGPVDEAGCSTTCAGCLPSPNNSSILTMNIRSNTNYTSAALVSAVVFLILICTLLFLHQRRNRVAHEEKTEIEDTSELHYLLSKLNEDLGKQVEKCWIDPNNLRIGCLLGNGNFGIVWSGRLSEGPVKEKEVAIKKIKGIYKDGYEGKLELKKGNDFNILVDKIRVEVELENQKIEDFLKEAVVMKKFNHPNVLSLIGISTHGDRPCAILPLMTNGDLKKYLNKNQSGLSLPNLLAFSLGVAKGMEHIAEQQFAHRDLAARNCMLDSDLMVKIADFGLMRSLHEEQCYRIQEKRRALPVRWMSLEALEDGVFTLKNDVWSFGVLLWEIFTFGEHPYGGIDTEDILN